MSGPRVALVSGAGSGIGRATATAFAVSGVRVLALDLAADALEATARTAAGIAVARTDVTDEEQVAAAVATAVQRWGRIDVVANVAGRYAPTPISELSPAVVSGLFATNVLGPILLTRAAFPHLRAAGGTVVNVSSTTARKATARASTYAATKAAVEQLTRCWALEFAPHGVRVNAVAPGPTDTPILANAGLAPEAVAAIHRSEVAAIPLGRRGRPEDVSWWILALAEPGCWVTGEIVTVDGGLGVT